MNVMFAIRCAVFILGVIINSFGIAFITRASLGTSPISGIPYVLSLRFNPTFGEFTFALNVIFVLIQILLLKRDFKKVQFFQLAATFIFSAAIDISMELLSWLNPTYFALKLVSLIIGCAILGFGIILEVYAKVLLVPGEGVVYSASRVFKKDIGVVKITFDVTLLLTATALSFIFFHRLNGLGAGTIISAVAVGLFVRLFNKKLSFIEKFLNRSRL